MIEHSPPIRVILIDDQSWVHDIVSTTLNALSDIRLVGQGHTGKDAMRLYEYYEPDIVLMDIVMPEMDGIAATRQLLERFPAARILTLSSFHDQRSIYGMLKNGAVGYLLKNALTDELATTIRTIYSGNTVLSPLVTKIIMDTSSPETKQDEYGLTSRELEVLKLLAEGLTNAQVAEELYIATPTVRFHLTNIIDKMGVSSRTEALVVAVKNKII